MINVQNISSKLASLPDQALKQYAQMHKEDPYVFSLALSESNRRKQLRMQAQQPAPQPKVVDQALQDMDVRKALPEDLGIARIPVDMNMASGGIVAFGDGGYVPRYKKEGLVDAKKVFINQYGPIAEAAGKELGVDPSILLAQWGMESRFGESTVGQFNVGNIKDFSGKGVKGFDKKEKSNSSYREYDSPEEFGQDYIKLVQRNFPKAIGAGADVNAFTSGLQNGRIGAYATDKDYGKTLAKTLTSLIPISAANAEVATPTNIPAAPQEADRSFMGQLKSLGQGITGIVAPEGAGGYAPGTRNFFERAADRFGVGEETQRNVSNTLNALPGVNVVNAPKTVGRLSAAAEAVRKAEMAAADIKAVQAEAKIANPRLLAPASTKRGVDSLTEEERVRRGLGAPTPVVPAKPLPDVNTLSEAERLKRGLSPKGPAYPLGPDAIKMQQELLARRGQVGNIGAKAPSGIEALTAPRVPPKTFPIGQETVEMQQKLQASRQAQQLRNLEADKTAAEAARKGVTTAKNAAQTSEAIEMANAARAANMANKVISPANKAVNTARQVQALKVGSDLPSVAEENKSAYQTDEAQELSNRYPAPVEKPIDYNQGVGRRDAGYGSTDKQIVAAAKDAVPKTEDTDGWSKNDWLQFGLSLMAGQSPYALSNIGAAGLAVISAKAEKAKEQNKLDLYKSVNADKPGQSIQIAERLMAADPKLTFEQALAKTTSLIGGSTREENSAIAAERVSAERLKNYQDAKTELYKTFQPYMTGTGPTAKAKQAEYQTLLKELQDGYSISSNAKRTPVADAASLIEVMSVRPNS
jgi:hypothetical protein